jgi:hypothetical protein
MYWPGPGSSLLSTAMGRDRIEYLPESVTRALRECYKNVPRVLRECCKSVTRRKTLCGSLMLCNAVLVLCDAVPPQCVAFFGSIV